MPDWNPLHYLKFERERTQPSRDLVSRITEIVPRTIIDLGCGTGNSTHVLLNRWPEASVIGLDHSAEMLGKARESMPGLTWVFGDIANWNPEEGFDLIFSNAALQWIPHHEELIPRILSKVAKGGALAVQLPYHYDSGIHQVLQDVSRRKQWSERTSKARSALFQQSPEFYYDLLASYTQRIELWTTQYYHILESAEAMVEWMGSTGMRPYLEALDNEAEREEFRKETLRGYRSQYPERLDGRILFPFKRLFFLAYPE